MTSVWPHEQGSLYLTVIKPCAWRGVKTQIPEAENERQPQTATTHMSETVPSSILRYPGRSASPGAFAPSVLKVAFREPALLGNRTV